MVISNIRHDCYHGHGHALAEDFHGSLIVKECTDRVKGKTEGDYKERRS
jgi:hypothetical protein